MQGQAFPNGAGGKAKEFLGQIAQAGEAGALHPIAAVEPREVRRLAAHAERFGPSRLEGNGDDLLGECAEGARWKIVVVRWP